MTAGKELRSRAFSLDPRFSYLSKEDRYLFHAEEPKFRFNVIGCGVNGNEHIHITLLEGRAIIHGVFDTNPGSVALAQQTCAGFKTSHDLVIYDSLEAACNDPAVDGLIISTPNYTHLDVLRVALQSGKHILPQLEQARSSGEDGLYERNTGSEVLHLRQVNNVSSFRSR